MRIQGPKSPSPGGGQFCSGPDAVGSWCSADGYGNGNDRNNGDGTGEGGAGGSTGNGSASGDGPGGGDF